MKHLTSYSKFFSGLVFFILIGKSQTVLGQSAEDQMNANDSLVSSSWILGLGINIVDDSGDNGLSLGNVGDAWNIMPFPSRLSAGRYFENGLGLEIIGTVNLYKAGKTVDNTTLGQDEPYWAVDSRLSYNLNHLWDESGIFDPYVGVGFGYTHALGLTRTTVNAALGSRIWLSQIWGVDVNATGKWATERAINNDHFQLGVGLVVRPKSKQKLSKKGKEKFERIQRQLEEEKQKRLDSIKKAEEAAALKAAKEREAREAEEAARRAAQKPDFDALQTQLNSKGMVYYELNKYTLNTNNKAILARIAEFMHANEKLMFEVHGHADSRGTQSYNLALSEKRAETTISYLISLGISGDRLTPIAHGESIIINGCIDHVRCSEADHAVNRRCEVKIVRN